MRHGLTRRRALGGVGAFLSEAFETRPDSSIPKITVDLGGYRTLSVWAEDARRHIATWWPAICGALAPADFDSVVLQFRSVSPKWIAAVTVGNVVTVNGPYVLSHHGSIGLVAHELVHVVQNYPASATVWLKEGIADYLRYYVLIPDDPERRYDVQAESFRRGYQPAAAMLAWSEASFGPGVVKRLNTSLRAGHDGETALKLATGLLPDQLWTAFRKSGKA